MPHRESRENRTDRRPLLSVCTILILSGFLIGLTTSREIPAEMQRLVLASGLLGVLAFIGLEQVAVRRRLREELREQELIENRLNRHVSRCELTRDLGASAEASYPPGNKPDVEVRRDLVATASSV